MPKERPIGLAELITQVKRDLLQPENEELPALLSVDEVTLELQVSVTYEAKGGVKIYVVELGGGANHEDLHNVSVKLTPLLTKEERIKLYKERFPERWKQVETAALQGGIKGIEEDV